MAESYSTDDVLRGAEILGGGTGAQGVAIWLLVGNQLRPATTWPSQDGRGVDHTELAPAGTLADLAGDVFVVVTRGSSSARSRSRCTPTTR